MAEAIAVAASAVAGWASGTAFQVALATGANLGTAATLANVVYGISYGVVMVGTYAGLAAVARPKMPSSDQSVPINEADPYSQWGYGRARISGKRMLQDAFDGGNAEVIAINQGRIHAVVQRYLHDDAVTLSGNTVVTTADDAYEFGAVKIYTNLGLPTETNFEAITSLAIPKVNGPFGFPVPAGPTLWPSAARGDGIHSVGLTFAPVKDKHVLTVYPNGPPQYSEVADLSVVYDWRKDSTVEGGSGAHRRDNESTWEFSENPIVCRIFNDWRHYGESWDRRFGTAAALEANTLAANVCDELVAKPEGGTEARYRCGFWFTSENQKADVRRKFMDCCDGRQFELPDGSWVMVAGQYIEPVGALTSRHILEVTGVRGLTDDQGLDELGFTYSSPEHGYQSQPGSPWVINEDAPTGQRRKQSVDLTGINSHSQGRRLLKRIVGRKLAKRRWTITTDAYGRSFMSQRWIRIQAPELGAALADAVVEVEEAEEVDPVRGRCEFSVVLIDPETIDSDLTEGEGGEAPPVTPPVQGVLPPQPTIEAVTVLEVGATATVLVEMTDYGVLNLTYVLQYRVGSGEWIESGPHDAFTAGANIAIQVSGLGASSDLEVQTASMIASYRSEWSESAFVDAAVVPDNTPTPPIIIDYADGVGSHSITWANPADGLVYGARVWRALSGSPFEDATNTTGLRLATPGTTDTLVMTGGPATYSLWVTTEAADGTPSAPAGPVTVIIT